MAHLENYTASQVGKMLSHYGREEDDRVTRSNENIRPEDTALNYAIFSDGIRSSRRLSETHAQGDKIGAYIKRKIAKTEANRKARGIRKMDLTRATVMSDWVFTLPRDWPEGRDPYEFFQLCHWFVRDRYGDECSLPGFVHMDETTPHMHCPIVPMIDGEIRKRDVLTRTDFKRFHSDLQSYLDEELGFHVSVLLDESQTAEQAKSRMSQDEMKALNADNEAKVRARVEAEVAERQRELDFKASEVARGKETNEKEATRLNRLSGALGKQQEDLDKQEASVKQDLGFLATLKDEVLALLKELRAALAEQRTLSQSRLDKIEEQLDEMEQQASKTNVTVEYDESYASWSEDTSYDADEYDIG